MESPSKLETELKGFTGTEKDYRLLYSAAFLRQLLIPQDRDDLLFQLKDVIASAHHPDLAIAWAAHFVAKRFEVFTGLDLLLMPPDDLDVILNAYIRPQDVPMFRAFAQKIFRPNISLPMDGSDPRGKGLPSTNDEGSQVIEDKGMAYSWNGLHTTVIRAREEAGAA